MTNPYYPVQQPPPKKKNFWTSIGGVFTIIGLTVLFCCGGGSVLIAATSDSKPEAAVSTKPVASALPVDVCGGGVCATATPTVVATTAPVASKSVAVPKTKPKPKPVVYATLNARNWKKLAKDPDRYSGKTYTIYGSVTQFDAATGDSTFRANAGPTNQSYAFEYATNSLFDGDVDVLDNIVEDDEFRAQVEVVGAYSYDTQIGGSTTVPEFRVVSIKIIH